MFNFEGIIGMFPSQNVSRKIFREVAVIKRVFTALGYCVVVGGLVSDSLSRGRGFDSRPKQRERTPKAAFPSYLMLTL